MSKRVWKRFFSGYYNLLLTSLTLLFIFRPWSEDLLYLAVWKLLLSAALTAAVFNVYHKTWVKYTILFLAIPAVILTWEDLWHPNHDVFIANAVITSLLMLICTGSILQDVVIRARVTMETLRGVIAAYCLVGFSFAYMYYLNEFLVPGTFVLPGESNFFSHVHYLSQMLYFSFGTLVGLGDIIAVKDVGRTLVVIECTIAQFYLAILVARIVSVYAFHAYEDLLRSIESQHHKRENR